MPDERNPADAELLEAFRAGDARAFEALVRRYERPVLAIARRFAQDHPELAVHVVPEPEQGVSCARRAGMDFASVRSKGRGLGANGRFLLVSADADCRVDPDWLFELCTAMESGRRFGTFGEFGKA